MSERSSGATGVCPAFGKAQFPSPAAAERRRKQLKINRDDRLEVFRCKYCKLWHLGHGRARLGKESLRRRPRNDWRREIEL